MPASPADVLIVGGGLAGSLLALALREQGTAVTLLDGSPLETISSATAISYGALPGWPLAPTPLARLAARASRRWQALQRRHGPLGWTPRALRLRGPNRGLEWFSRLGGLPFAQVDTAVLQARLPVVLAAAGVVCKRGLVQSIASDGACWRLALRGSEPCHARQVVLAAGAHCRDLWPALPSQLRSSWASVLELEAFPPALGAAAAWLPQGFQRLALERQAADLQQLAWVVDPGLVPWGGGALLGQHTWIGGGAEPGSPPAAERCEAQLRDGLASTGWAQERGLLRQAAVAFCSGGGPLVGPVAAAPGLWMFSGFSAGFSQVPMLAPLLAQRLTGSPPLALRAERRLQQLGVWPAGG